MPTFRSTLTMGMTFLALQLGVGCTKNAPASTTPPAQYAEAAPMHGAGHSHQHNHCHVDPKTATLGCHGHSHGAGPGHH